MGQPELDIRLRPFRDSDQAFVLNSWKESYRWAPEVRWVPNATYYNEMNRRVDELIKRGHIVVACNPVADDHIIGWCCVEGAVLHYVYVKTPMRGSGYALALLRDAKVDLASVACSHWTEVCELFSRKHKWIYAPSTIALKKGKAA